MVAGVMGEKIEGRKESTINQLIVDRRMGGLIRYRGSALVSDDIIEL
jgi:hypothetical protein